MARKSEVGIEYFPINSDIIHSPKIRLVVAEFGSKTTWAVLLPLYCKIYREKGYWIDWFDEDSKLLFAQDECKIELSVVNEFVNGCIRRSLFNKEVFDMFGVLTSDRIQDNYLTAKVRNKSVVFIEDFACKTEKGEYVYTLFQNVNTIDLSVNTITKKVDAGTQKKKESKKEITEGDTAAPPNHSKGEMELFKKFQSWVKTDAARANQLKEPLTIDQFLKLDAQYGREPLKEILKDMHNYKPLLTQYVSANMVVHKWMAKRKPTINLHNEPQTTNTDAGILAAIERKKQQAS